MNNLLKKIDYYINKYTNLKFKEEDKLIFLESIEYDKFLLYDNTTILKVLYSALTKNEYKLIVSYLNELEEGFNKITSNSYSDFVDLIKYYLKTLNDNNFDNLFINEENHENKLEKFNALNYPENVKNLIIRIIKDLDNNIDFNKYNLFISFFNARTKIMLMQFIKDVLILRKIKYDEDYRNTLGDIIIDDIKSRYNFVLNDVKDGIRSYKNDYRKFNKNKEKNIEIYTQLRNKILSNKEINLSTLTDINERLLVNLIIYNIKLKDKIYLEENNKNVLLNKNNINEIDRILNKHEFKINSNDIKINIKDLEKKLININEHLIEVKKYNNILLLLINELDIDKFNIIIKLILNNEINCEYILNNIDYLCNKEKLNNFINNIKLFKDNNISIENIIKYDENILISNYINIKNIINIYKLYNIKLDKECYNYELLNNDYSNIIDKFIEIGEYELIKNNPNLINNESDKIIKRCSLYKDIKNICINEYNRLKGNIRKEETFIVNDNILDEIVIENYNELLTENILEVLNNNNNIYNNIDLSIIDNYKENELIYNINGLYISKNKIIKNMNKLLNSELLNEYSYSELLYYSIIYNYPKLITLHNINNLKNILDIKKILKPSI